MELTISHLSKQEGRSLEWNSKVANLPLTLMWRYIGRAVTDGEFGVLQSKLNLFQMDPLRPDLSPHGRTCEPATAEYRQTKSFKTQSQLV